MRYLEPKTKSEEKKDLLHSIRMQERTAIRMAEVIASGREDEKGKQMLDTLISNEINSMRRNTLEFLAL